MTDLDADPGFDSFIARPITENGIGVGQSVLVLDPESGTENILAGPGSFTPELQSEGFDYSVTVEDCTGSAPGNAGASTPEASQATPAPVVQPKNRERAKGVDRRTVPKTRLAPTGGVPLSYVVYGMVLGGASLLALGLVRRGR